MTIALAAGVALSAAAGNAAKAAPKHDVLDIHHLPLGDGHVSSTPRRGYVMACRRGPGRGRGARHAGPWIHGRTWDLTEKTQVQGRVTWPQARFTIQIVGEGRVVRRIEGNGLPVKTPTGRFPVSRNDPAHRIDPNPNRIEAQHVALTLPAEPKLAREPSCVPMGMIGVALNGVAIFNAIDDAGRDAVAHEVQDLCDGHPQMRGEYHYHGPSRCLPNERANEKLIGYALDGFGIYSMYDAHGRELTDADLDACHGRTSTVMWNGRRVAIYHYVLTREYPYTVGCFRGTPVSLHRVRRPRHMHRPPPGFRPPPPGRGSFGPPPPRRF
ncbi:MAG: YHYH protein [Pseudolabrys sp.]